MTNTLTRRLLATVEVSDQWTLVYWVTGLTRVYAISCDSGRVCELATGFRAPNGRGVTYYTFYGQGQELEFSSWGVSYFYARTKDGLGACTVRLYFLR